MADAFQQKDDTFSLFKNDKKRKDNDPDYTGRAKVNGKEFDISAWIKTSAKGTKWMSGSFRPPWQESKGTAPPPAIKKDSVADMDSDIPF